MIEQQDEQEQSQPLREELSQESSGNRPNSLYWLLEGMLIFFSVLLAFGLSGWRESQSELDLAGRALDGIRAEIEYNLTMLEPFVPMHDEWVQALANIDVSAEETTGLDVFFETRPEFPAGITSSFPSLRRSAWDAAVAGGTIQLIEYDVTVALADIYSAQELTMGNIQRLATGALSTPEVYADESKQAAIRLLWLTLADIQSIETVLLDRYRQYLPAVTAAVEDYQ